MRAREIFTKRKRTPVQSLRHLNSQKQYERDRQASLDRHLDFVGVMYRDFDHETRELNLEKLRIELEQMKADLIVSKREAGMETSEAIHRMAVSGVRSNDKSQARVAKMARANMRKRKT